MLHTLSITQKFRRFLAVLLPILVSQCALFAMTFLDTVMSGNAGAYDLAGVAIGSSIWLPVFTGLTGILSSVTPIVAQFAGAKRPERIPATVVQGVYVALLLSVFVLIGGAFALHPLLQSMNLESPVRDIAGRYLIALSLGIVPLFVYTVFRCFIDALGYTGVTMRITLLSLPINALLNYLLIFGAFGFPRLGGVGAGYASAITYWCIALIAFTVIRRDKRFQTYHVLDRLFPVSFSAWKEQLHIGLPIGFAIFFETSIFAAVTLLMSTFDTITIAAHQVALNLASMLYMIPLSISMALTIVIGFEAGAGRFAQARQYIQVGIGLALIVAVLNSLLIYFFNDQVAALYTTDTAVHQLAREFLVYAIFFQLSDAIATPIQGALRGYKDVNVTLLATFISYWLAGLPIGYLLATYTSWGPFGYWVGLIAGLAVGAVLLSVRLILLQRKYGAVAGG
ncbi:MATE family efflux transporter [Heliobacillus mobilis]|uniref:Probable multidrug resistance protein NorM n=1 Tax=Heliobacterium mobile TaxID=28064 RepID=A0A6I3SLY8_HELMO|nr:MATE family efflux transporter [Heliobacterium mobile]